MGRKVNQSPSRQFDFGFEKKTKKNEFNKEYFGISFALPWYSIRGVSPTRGMFLNLSRVVDFFTSEIHHSRETGTLEQPQREVRRPLLIGQGRWRLRNFTRAVVNPVFIPLCLANHTSTDQVTTSLRSSIVVSPSLLPALGFGAAPATQDAPRAIASSAVPAETIGR